MRSALCSRVLLATPTLTAGAQAMSAANYGLEWLIASRGSGEARSPRYRAQFTVGQMAVGCASSRILRGCGGVWAGGEAPSFRLYLPGIVRQQCQDDSSCPPPIPSPLARCCGGGGCAPFSRVAEGRDGGPLPDGRGTETQPSGATSRAGYFFTFRRGYAMMMLSSGPAIRARAALHPSRVRTPAACVRLKAGGSHPHARSPRRKRDTF
ncbi:MAG: hypothetical protein NZ765_12505 [Anaerolineae bacterium]|nr:hypothetical protein [Anaerolineae bacterium]MDW8071188.1 hypothetical protein [Anaerolineae bacterium]